MDEKERAAPRLGDLRLAIGLCVALAVPPLLGLPATGWDGRHDEPLRAPVEPLVVDVNHAPPGLLQALPGVGQVLAGRIAEERSRGRFLDVDDLRARVRGIGPDIAGRMAPHVRFGAR